MYWFLREGHAWSALFAAGIAGAGLLMSIWSPREPARRSRMFHLLMAVLGCQLLSGLLLYVTYSPYTAGVRANVDIVLNDPTLRHWNVVHPVLGMIGIVAVPWAAMRRTTRAPAFFVLMCAIIAAIEIAALRFS